MYKFPIGVLLESFKTDTRTAIEKAAAIGASGIQIYATNGEFNPDTVSDAKISETLDMLSSNGMRVSALCGDMGRGFFNPELNPELIAKSKRILDLAKRMGTDIVTTHIGVVPQDKNHERYKIMQEACSELAEYADSIGSHFAVETGPETSAVLAEFLDSLNSTGVAVNLDPANLVMVTGDNPVDAVYNLRKYIVHTHAKDGRKLLDVNPEIIYGVVAASGPSERAFIELPLGDGEVDFEAYLAALDDIGYKGFLTIEREVGDEPEKDIVKAANYLRAIIG